MNKTEKEYKASSDDRIQWHPAFYAAAEIELRSNKEDLIFQQEYNLSKKPLQIDLLVIEKMRDIQIENEIGHIFRKYNVVEYKSPDDGLNIDDFTFMDNKTKKWSDGKLRSEDSRVLSAINAPNALNGKFNTTDTLKSIHFKFLIEYFCNDENVKDKINEVRDV